MHPKYYDCRKRNPFGDLVSVLTESELIGLEVRLRRDESTEYLAEVVSDEREQRHILSDAEIIILR